MLRSTALLRNIARLVVLLPFAVGCGSEGSALNTAGPGGAGSSGAASSGAASSGGPGTSGGPGSSSGAPDGAVPADTVRPVVVSTWPVDGDVSAASNATIGATFTKAMAPLTITGATFVVKQGANVIPGVRTYFNKTVTFAPASALDLGTTYTATVTTGATDLAGNTLAVAYVWSFTTDATAPLGPAPVLLGGAGHYAILAKAAITNVPTSKITGDLGLSPAAATGITGFALTDLGPNWISAQVTGSIFGANNAPPTPSNLTTAVLDMETAFTDAAGRPTPTFLDLGAGTIGGLTLTPGLYRWDSALTIPVDITIAGAHNDVWIFQITGDLLMTAAQRMTLSGGAQAKNIYWQVSGAVDLGTASHAEGVLIAKTAITLGTGASVNGRLFAQTAVTLASNTVTVPAP